MFIGILAIAVLLLLIDAFTSTERRYISLFFAFIGIAAIFRILQRRRQRRILPHSQAGTPTHSADSPRKPQ